MELLHVLKGHTRSIKTLCFSGDGMTLFSGAYDGTVRLWEPESGECLHAVSVHMSGVSSIARDPFGSGAASASWDGRVRILDQHGKVSQTIDNRLTQLGIDRLQHEIASSESAGHVIPQELEGFLKLQEISSSLVAEGFNSSGAYVTVNRAGEIRSWRAR